MMTFGRWVLSGLLLGISVGCSGGALAPACEKSAAIDLDKKAGNCTGLDLRKPLGTRSECAEKVKPCTAAETETLATIVACLENLPTCSAAAQSTFLGRQAACYASVPAMAMVCRVSVFGTAPLPGTDAGSYPGPQADAGRQPSDGGGAVELIGVADESGFAFAWSTSQRGQVAVWELNVFGTDGGRLAEIYLSPSSTRAYEMAVPKRDAGTDAGPEAVARRFFIAGIDNQGLLVSGDPPDAGVSVIADAGGCTNAIQCVPTKVCDLGTCKTQTCQPGGAVTCPFGYTCEPGPMSCFRQFSDAGTLDAGPVVGGGTFIPLPMVSQLVSVATGTPGVSPETPIGGFAARRLDLVAMDSARQFVALEQESQLFGHFTSRRGKELVNDTGSASPIDPAGSRPSLSYVPESDTVFGCYNFGRGVRIRRSRDLGKSWGDDAITIAPDDTDGGVSSRFYDCSIAPWKNGSAIFAYIADDTIVVRTVTEALSLAPLTAADTVFTATAANAGNIFNPQRPYIATLPGTLLDGGPGSMVHVGFTGTRAVGSTGSDTEIYGLYRDGTTGTFLGPTVINYTGQSNSSPQDHVSIVVNPKSGKALAAYTTIEVGAYATVYTALFFPANKLSPTPWITSSDLTVFAKKLSETLLFPAKPESDVWDAFSPSVAASKNGKLYLSVVAGKRTGTTRDLRMYLMGFDFDATSPIAGGGQGWFTYPAVKLSDTKVLDPRAPLGVVPPNVSAICTDTQLSVYGVFVEGIGAMSEIENRAVFVSRP